MTKSSFVFIAVCLLFLTTAVAFRSPIIAQTVYPTPTSAIDSCTGSTSCTAVSISDGFGCSCAINGSKIVQYSCLGADNNWHVCGGTCQKVPQCLPTPTAGPCNCAYPKIWNDIQKWDCGGSSCGCHERRTSEGVCSGVHCSDTCMPDMTCTEECVPTPSPTPTEPPIGPVYYGALSAKAVTVSGSDTSCNTIVASTNYLLDTIVSFSPAVNPSSQTQAGAVLSWPSVRTNVYSISSTPPGQYALANSCVSQNGGAYTQYSTGTLTNGGTLAFAIGYLPQAGWVQTVGGDAYAGNTIVSSVPTSANTYFSLAGAMGEAGIVSYGSTYDFSLSASDLGETLVSTKKWLIQHSNTPVDFYAQFASKLDVPGSATTIDTPLDLIQPSSCTTAPCVYYVDGDMTTATGSPWTIGASDQTIVFVNGNATINSPITIIPGGFFALIVNGNITIVFFK